VIYWCWCIVSNICMRMHPGDAILDGTMNVCACAAIAGDGVTGDG